jgi:hypothetical protein
MNRRRAWCVSCILAGALLMTGSAWGAAGDQLWETPFNFLPTYNTTLINGMSVSSTSLIVCGTAFYSDSSGAQIGKSIGFIKAFDVATGAVKWGYTLEVGGNNNGFGQLAVANDIVLVKGSSGTFSGSPAVFTLNKNYLRAYAADNGALLWEVVKDFEATPSTNPPGFTNVVVAKNRAFTVPGQVDINGKRTGICYARAYQVQAGEASLPLLLLGK